MKLTPSQDGHVPVLVRLQRGEAVTVFPCEPYGQHMLAVGPLGRPFGFTRADIAKTTPAPEPQALALCERLEHTHKVRLRLCQRITDEQEQVLKTRAQRLAAS